MIDSLVVLKLKDNKISFDQIPDGVGVKIKNYDIGPTPMFLEEDLELQFKLGLSKDEDTGEWYRLELFVEPKNEFLDQLNLPFQVEEA